MKTRLASLLIALVTAVMVPTGAIGQGRMVEMGITSTEMAQYFQQHAGAQDIARVDHPNDIGLISGLTVGKKMVIFKSVAQISQFLASNANALDIVGYNLEPGQTHDPNELANPVAAAQAVQAIARKYGKLVAIGLTHDLTLRYGPSMAPYADLWVLQIQKAQNDPQMAAGFVNQMVPALVKANPAIKVFVQIRTDSQPAALAKLVNGLGPVNVSILTQRSDVQDAINVASQFFGKGGSQAPANFQPVKMANGSQYGIRVPAKLSGWFAPVASNLIGSNERDHLGRGSINAWDWSTAIGSPVFAIGPGMVKYSGCNDAGHYGCWVSISHGNGLQSDYAHCLENSITVQAGQQVDASTQLCNIGRTGWTDWPHVHLAIKLNGSPQPITNYFDTSLVVYCHFSKCQASNDPNAPIAGMGTQATGQATSQQVTVTTSKGQQILQALAALPAEQFGLLVAVLVFLFLFAFWLSGLYVRVALVSMAAAGLAAGCVAILFMPVQQVTAQPAQTAVVSGDWEKSYEITQGREGWKCTEDGAHTQGGVTQGTYNRWRAKHGLGKADVCQALTREEAKQIFYELFWLPVGADKMPFNLALTVVDHYYNTGKVSHLLAQCGQDVKCFNNARIVDYKGMGNCSLYCAGWINRVNHIRTLTEGNQS